MLKRRFGWTGVEVPIIGQGTWMIEGNSSGQRRQAVESLRLGLELGMRHIDTAEMYGNGIVEEEIVSEAIDGRRDEVFLVSKVLPSNASYEGTIRACEQSLKRLKTDWIDLYLLHWPGSHPIEQTMHAMEKLVADGMIRFIGVSNFCVEELKAAEETLITQRIACNQVLYHLSDRAIELRLLPYCARRGIAVVGYSPFGHGNFPSPRSSAGQVLAEIAKRHGRTGREVALNFLTRHPSTFTIPKSRSIEHVRENSAAGDGWNLTNKDLAAIEAAFPLPKDGTPLKML